MRSFDKLLEYPRNWILFGILVCAVGLTAVFFALSEHSLHLFALGLIEIGFGLATIFAFGKERASR